MGKRVKSYRILCVCLFIAIFLVGCQMQRKHERAAIRIGVLCYNQSDTYISELVTTFMKQINESKVGKDTVIVMKDGVGSQRTQNEQAEELVASQCDILCVNLVDRNEPSEIIRLAREHDIPVIFFNREPVPEDMRQWNRLYYVGADARQSGQLQGELAAGYILDNPCVDKNNDGKIQYVVLEGEAGHQDAILRTEKSVNTLKEKGIRLEKIGSGIANWNRAQAENRMEQLIQLNHDGIELVLSNNDEMAIGAYNAYKKLNFTKQSMPIFFGVDGTEVGILAVRDGVLAGTVYNNKEGQATAMRKLCEEIEKDKKGKIVELDKYIYLPYSIITKETVGQYLR